MRRERIDGAGMGAGAGAGAGAPAREVRRERLPRKDSARQSAAVSRRKELRRFSAPVCGSTQPRQTCQAAFPTSDTAGDADDQLS